MAAAGTGDRCARASAGCLAMRITVAGFREAGEVAEPLFCVALDWVPKNLTWGIATTALIN
jgi:hypothetical protein